MLILMSRWVVLEEIPFLRAIRSVPEAMRAKLPVEYANHLDLMVGDVFLARAEEG